MKQTPLQRLIKWVLEYPTEVPVIHKSAVISKLKSLLPYEREVIEEAYGTKKKYGSQIDPEIITGSEYYTQTFTDESKSD